jgi:hypothetical protein
VKRTFRALDTVVTVACDDRLACAPLIARLIGGYADTDEPAELVYDIYDGRVDCRGVFERGVRDAIDLPAIFELDLYQQVVERAAPGWILHAASLVIAGTTIVLAGPSGAGKTTLTLALSARGAEILSEEIVAIDGDLNVRALARPIHLAGARVPDGWDACPYPIRTDRGIVKHMISAPPRYVHAAPALGLVVRIDHGPGRAPRLDLLAPRAALAELWPCTLRQYPRDLELAMAVTRRVSARLCSTSTVGDAVDLIESAAVSLR